MEHKTINITGKNNIDKMTKTKSKREIINTTNLDESEYIHSNQVLMINQYFLDNKCSSEKYLLRELKNKLNSYKGQDRKKQCYDDRFFISLNKLIELLVASKLKCYYCKEQVFIYYKLIREPKQWTLDRIDNEQGHNMENCVIACLACNIQRKTLDDKKFKFTKQMKIIKKN
jgi:5-methylcytosine-specific restriction endonuclease McrA